MFLGVIDVVSVILPGTFLLARFGRVKIAAIRNLTVIVSSFAILHGIYHASALAGLNNLAFVLDFISTIILVVLGAYYARTLFGIGLFTLVFADVAGAMRDLVPAILVVALILFVILAIRSRNLSSLQSQLSIFLVIWIIAELFRALINAQVIFIPPALQLLRLEIHTVAMVAFGFFMLSRFYRVTRSRGNTPSGGAQTERDRNVAE